MGACSRSLTRSLSYNGQGRAGLVNPGQISSLENKKKANSKRRGDRVCPTSTALLVPVGPVGSHPVPYKPKRRAQDAAKFCSRRS
jgi:hypothetical protein